MRDIYKYLSKFATLDLLIATGSFRAASAQACVTQSAISQTISTLESRLGFSLVVRDMGSARPTPECLQVLGKLRPILDDLGRLDEEMKGSTSNSVFMLTLEVGIFESLAINIFPKLFRRLKAQHPNMRVKLKIGRSGELLQMLRKKELRTAIITEIDNLEGVTQHALAEDRLGVYVSPDLALAYQGQSSLEHVGLCTLASPNEGFPKYFTKYLQKLSVQPSLFCESFEVLRAMAVEGSVAAILPTRVARLSQQSSLVELDMNIPGAMSLHKILMVTPSSCIVPECEYLVGEMKKIFCQYS